MIFFNNIDFLLLLRFDLRDVVFIFIFYYFFFLFLFVYIFYIIICKKSLKKFLLRC